MASEEDVFEELLVSAAELRKALTDLEAAIRIYQRERSRGVAFSTIYRQHRMREIRDVVYERLAAFERSFNAARAMGVRSMVDEEGLTLTDVSRMMRRSRQFVTRLYRAQGGSRPDSQTEPVD